MTYNQLKKTITTLLQSNAMIKEVKFATPQDWLFATNQPEFPLCCFMINSGSLNIGREQVYNVSFWFLDKAGMENEFEADVTSAFHSRQMIWKAVSVLPVPVAITSRMRCWPLVMASTVAWMALIW